MSRKPKYACYEWLTAGYDRTNDDWPPTNKELHFIGYFPGHTEYDAAMKAYDKWTAYHTGQLPTILVKLGGKYKGIYTEYDYFGEPVEVESEDSVKEAMKTMKNVVASNIINNAFTNLVNAINEVTTEAKHFAHSMEA